MKTIFKGLLFVVTLVALAYAGVLLEKKKINAMVEFPEVTSIEHRVDTIVVFKDGRDYDWEIFTQALIWVESKGDSKAVGSKDDTGVLQITPILLQDCNRILKTERFTLEDRLDSLKSVEMFNIIQDHYNPQHDYHLALKIWNGKAPLSYHRKVMDKFNEIKEARP